MGKKKRLGYWGLNPKLRRLATLPRREYDFIPVDARCQEENSKKIQSPHILRFSSGTTLGASEHFANCPNVIRDSRFHRRRDPQCLMDSAKVVISEVQRTRDLQIVQFLAEGVGQARKPANCHSHGEVLPLNVRSAHVFGIGVSLANLGYNLHDWLWGVPPGSVVLAVIPVQLYDLPEVDFRAKVLFNGIDVKAEAISRELDAIRHAVRQIANKRIRSGCAALADCERGDQLRIGIKRYENPRITDFGGIVFAHAALFLANEGPNFIGLNMLASQIAHPLVHEFKAGLTGKNEQPHDGIPMQPRNPLGSADAGSFDEQLHGEQPFIFRHDHGAEQAGMIFRVGFPALCTAEALKAVAMFPEFAALCVAIFASHCLIRICLLHHVHRIQQALVVCQEKSCKKSINL